MAVLGGIICLDLLGIIIRDFNVFSVFSCWPLTCMPRTDRFVFKPADLGLNCGPSMVFVVMDCPALVLSGFGTLADRPSTWSTDLCRNCGQGDVYVCFCQDQDPGRQA